MSDFVDIVVDYLWVCELQYLTEITARLEPLGGPLILFEHNQILSRRQVKKMAKGTNAPVKKRRRKPKIKTTPTRADGGPIKVKFMKTKEKLMNMYLLFRETKLEGKALVAKFNAKYGKRVINREFVKRHLTQEKYDAWRATGEIKRKVGSGRPSIVESDEMDDQLKAWIADDSILMKDIPALFERKYKKSIDVRTLRNHYKRGKENPDGYHSHVTPLQTPLSAHDEKIRLAYALHGPINNWTFEAIEDICNILKLPKSWKERKKLIAFWDHKPFYLGKFHRHNARQNRFKPKEGEVKKPLKPGRQEKFSPKFMVFGLLGYSFSEDYFHCKRVKNQRRSRNAEDELIHKYSFKHPSVDQQEINAAADTFIPILKQHGIKLLIGDCDSKLHNKKLAKKFLEHGIFLWPGGGKGAGNHPFGYPPRSHDCNPCENWFSQWQTAAALLMKSKDTKSMLNWFRCLKKARKDMKKTVWQKLIDTQPKVMKAIIEKNGGRTKY